MAGLSLGISHLASGSRVLPLKPPDRVPFTPGEPPQCHLVWKRAGLRGRGAPSLTPTVQGCRVEGQGGVPRVLGPPPPSDRGAEAALVQVSLQTERLTAEQIKEYKGVFEMFDEEGNGQVKTAELERLMSLLGINPTKSELASMAQDVDRDNKGFFNCDSFLALMGIYWEKAQNQEGELRAAFRVFDKDGKGYIDWNTLKYVLTNAGEPLSEAEAEQMMKEADKDGDGTIDYEEFVAMMTGESFKLVQ
ncbi:calmodulin-like protein 6 [Mustela lutreola]|uniref:calmodulin-like protein 6 n=1 Tax=Mustela lutreola TaxID=9666 RepID=UPI002796F02D|nr:calmodulin-like protein 6 [Mustela lutreola]